ncbi:MAG: hypothetical protein IPJ88_07350 [Myxococcales bacterium]|nr:MAG: hypothetical protein IPJ88_07350 [Myxococcales bacterium]
MNKTTQNLVLIAVLNAFLFAGCSSDDSNDSNGGGTTINSSISSSKQISDLTDTEASTLCQEGEAASNNVENVGISIGCYMETLSDSAVTNTTECETSLDSCVNNPNNMSDSTGACDFEDAAFRENCTTTVGELEDCMNALSALATDVLGVLSCAPAGDEAAIQTMIDDLMQVFGLSDPQEFDNYDPFVETTECAPVVEKCPGMMGD